MKISMIWMLVFGISTHCFAMQQASSALTLISSDGKSYPVPIAIALQAKQIQELLNSDCAEAESYTFEFKSFNSRIIQNLAQIMWFIEQNKSMKEDDLLVSTAQKFSEWSLDEICAAWNAGDLLEFPYINEFAVECFAQKLNTPKQQITLLRIRRACRAQIPADKCEPLIEAVQKRINELENESKNFSRPPTSRRNRRALAAARHATDTMQNAQHLGGDVIDPQIPHVHGPLQVNTEEGKGYHIAAWPCIVM